MVPGVSSAIAAPAYAGIPLTLRHSSTLFTVITGHEDPDKPGEIDWEAVAGLGGTIVVLMGVGRWPAIAARLMAGGLTRRHPGRRRALGHPARAAHGAGHPGHPGRP